MQSSSGNLPEPSYEFLVGDVAVAVHVVVLDKCLKLNFLREQPTYTHHQSKVSALFITVKRLRQAK